MLSGDELGISIALAALRSSIELLAAHIGLIAQVLIPGIGVKFADPKSPVAEISHRLGEIGAAALLDRSGLPRCWRCNAVRQDASRQWFTAGANRVPRRDADRTGRIGIAKGQAALH